MKLYDFLCEACHLTFEDLQSQDEIIACPTCQQPATKLLTYNPSAPMSAKMQDLFNKFAQAKAKYKNVSKDQMPHVK